MNDNHYSPALAPHWSWSMIVTYHCTIQGPVCGTIEARLMLRRLRSAFPFGEAFNEETAAHEEHQKITNEWFGLAPDEPLTVRSL